ncbi:MAG: NPCBM/NEW2 domain-containing protein [Planctomycetes bacterium]|nr:NPCBM/NEW2 domain-containing protein [Planctomycetota bacterium]
MVDGDRLRGLLAKGLGESGFLLRSPSLGEIEVPLERVATVRFAAAAGKAADPPELRAGERSDRFFFASGDRLDGTLRSLGPEGAKVRTAAGEERTLAPDSLLGFALLPLGAKPEKGLRIRVALEEGTLLSGTSLAEAGKEWLLRGAGGGTGPAADRTVPPAAVIGLAVRGGRGTPLPDLAPASVEVRAYWGEDPPVLDLRPRTDRAFTLEPGPAPPLRAAGVPHLRGLSMFSGTTVTYDLAGKGFRRFVASVAVDDAGPKGAVEFEILLDGKSAWRSPVVRSGAPPLRAPGIDLSAAKSLALVVHAGPGDDVQDYADWLRAAFLP